jgi:8-oxo-dGTP pyrophosphatase MutT (NUDIX family)
MAEVEAIAIDTAGALASEGTAPISGESERSWPNLKPRRAATLILIDRTKPAPHVLMGKRHAGHAFMPGKFVFPGGRIEPADRRMSVAGALPALVEHKLLQRVARPSPGQARALALAAIRETFEETGLLVGTKDYGVPETPPAGAWSEFAKHGVFPTLEGLHFVARAITPPRRPRRFDAAFFAVDAAEIAHRIDGMVGPQAEFVELVWLPLEEAKHIDLPTITQVVLGELGHRIAQGMGHHLPVPFFSERNKRWYRDEL